MDGEGILLAMVGGRYEGGRMTALCESLVLDTSKGEMQVAYIHNSYRAGGGKSMVAKKPWLCTPQKKLNIQLNPANTTAPGVTRD
jgi:hypothetical protein